MISDLAIAIPIAVACVLVSAFCSGTEVALFSLRRVDREQLARSTGVLDRRVVVALERPRRLIATALIGNEACHGVLAALALGVAWRWFAPWSSAGIALAVALPVVVLLTEVTAKTLAAKAPLGWARTAAWPLQLFTWLVTPVRLIVGGVTSVLLLPLGDAVRARPARDLSEEEFRKLVDAGSAQGQVDARERRLIHRVFEFSDKNVGQIMTPRDRIFALNYDLPMQRIVREVAARGFSRVPIYQKTLDNVRGIVNAKDLVRAATGYTPGTLIAGPSSGPGTAPPLGALLHEPLFVPRTTPVKRLFVTFKTKKVHMALVVSEYGKVLGLVTMDDVLAQIFGVIRDERTGLQDSLSPDGRDGRDQRDSRDSRARSRTPGGGGVPKRADTGPIAVSTPTRLASEPGAPIGLVPPDALPIIPLDGDTGPVRLEDVTGPVPRPSESSFYDPVDTRGGATSGDTDTALRALTPVEPPAVRPIHARDEDTPPASDIAELLAGSKD